MDKSYLIHPLFMHTLMSPKPFKATDSCISCGLCEKACPVRNIHLKERGKPEWGVIVLCVWRAIILVRSTPLNIVV